MRQMMRVYRFLGSVQSLNYFFGGKNASVAGLENGFTYLPACFDD